MIVYAMIPQMFLLSAYLGASPGGPAGNEADNGMLPLKEVCIHRVLSAYPPVLWLPSLHDELTT